jgi:hypothetical protein
MADTFEQLQNNIKSEAVQTAKKAIDYLENDMKWHLEELLKFHIRDWKKRKFVPVYENPTRILVERSAKSYKTPPKRVVNINGEASEAQTQAYSDLLKRTNIDFISQDVDARARITAASLLMPQYDEESKTINLSVLSRDNCDVKLNRITGAIDGIIYTAGYVGLNGGQIYHIWTPEEIRDYEGEKLMGVTDNPYGMVPAAILHDIRPPATSELWRYKKWEQLTQLSDGINLFNTEALFNARYGMVGSPVTNMEIPEGTVTGIDSPLSLNSNGADTPFFEFTSPTMNVTEVMNWFKPFRESIADEWGVNLNIAGSGTADSGFKLVVEEFENIELRQTRIQAAKEFEYSLYNVFATMSEVHDFGLDKAAECMADFDEPSLPVNNAEEWMIAKEQIALGLLSPEEYWKSKNPDLTVEDLAAKRRAYDQSRGLAATVPTFEA